LYKRNLDWNRLLYENKWLFLYFIYCLTSILWAGEPYVLFKRWIKDLGNPIMALVILTEPDPYQAVGLILKRLAFLMLPLSLLVVRYFPSIGRGYGADGTPIYTGIGHQKNDLGLLCLITGMYFCWNCLQNRKGGSASLWSAMKAEWMQVVVVM